MTTSAVTPDRVSTIMHVRCQDGLPEAAYRQVLELKGALRYHGTDARRLGEILRIRSLSRLGVDVRVGIGPTMNPTGSQIHACLRP